MDNLTECFADAVAIGPADSWSRVGRALTSHSPTERMRPNLEPAA
jgi:hypothetical protein